MRFTTFILTIHTYSVEFGNRDTEKSAYYFRFLYENTGSSFYYLHIYNMTLTSTRTTSKNPNNIYRTYNYLNLDPYFLQCYK
jgi:hypothetical protein